MVFIKILFTDNEDPIELLTIKKCIEEIKRARCVTKVKYASIIQEEKSKQ